MTRPLLRTPGPAEVRLWHDRKARTAAATAASPGGPRTLPHKLYPRLPRTLTEILFLNGIKNTEALEI